jgi:WD40 repeat protein
MDQSDKRKGESNSSSKAGHPAKSQLSYLTKFVTTHKGPCRAAAFSPDGTQAATGSADASIKLLEVEKMHYLNEVMSN